MNPEVFKTYTRLEHANRDLSKIVNVNWCMGNTCNFECSYCPKSLHDGSHGWYDYDSVLRFCDKIITHYAGNTVYFEFTGGEVTLWKHFPDLCKWIKSQGHKVGFISNSSRTLRWWEDILPHADHVCLSFHPEAGDKQHFFTVAALTSQHFRTHVNLMMLPDRFDELYEFAEQLTDIPNISMALQPLLINFGEQVYPYSAEQQHRIDNQYELVSKRIQHDRHFETYRGAMAMIEPSGKRTVIAPQKFISMQQNDWQGWQCHAGLENIIVDMDGKLFRGWCRVGGSIGHVLDPQLMLPTHTVTCDKARCHCNFDIMCTKEKIDGLHAG
jgi:organic radical activating enzyme